MLTMWWFMILAVVGCLVVLFTPKGERIATDENRVLQNAPDFSWKGYFSGQFGTDFENFLSDSVPFRTAFISFSNKMTGLMAMNTTEDAFYLDTTMEEAAAYSGDETEGDGEDTADETTEDGTEDAGTGTDKAAVDTKNGAVFELVKRSGGTKVVYTYPEENLKLCAKNIEEVVSLIPGDGNLYLTYVPFPVVAFRLTDALDVYSGWQCNHIEKLDQLTSDRVKCFNTLEILEPHMLAGENLFLRLSHQWHIHGAYDVFCEMIKAQGLTPTPYDEYEYKVNHRQNYAKDTFELLYPLAPPHNYRVRNIDEKTEISFMYYTGATNGSYLHGDQRPWHTIETGFHTGRKALVIGDCFALSFTTFLLPYYDEVHMTDVRIRLFNRKELGTSVADMMQRNFIDDVYVIFSEAHGVNSETMLKSLPKHLY